MDVFPELEMLYHEVMRGEEVWPTDYGKKNDVARLFGPNIISTNINFRGECTGGNAIIDPDRVDALWDL